MMFELKWLIRPGKQRTLLYRDPPSVQHWAEVPTELLIDNAPTQFELDCGGNHEEDIGSGGIAVDDRGEGC